MEVPESASSSVAAPTGKVRFRFFPASAQVRVDGSTVKPQRAGSNVVELKLSAGKHSVTLVGADGRRRKTTFQVRAGQLTNLATLSLEEGSQP